MDAIQKIDRELEQLHAQKRQEISSIDDEIDVLDAELMKLFAQKRLRVQKQQEISSIEDQFNVVDAKLNKLFAKKQTVVLRIDDEIAALERKMGINLNTSAIRQLYDLCERINTYFPNPEYGYPVSY